MVARTEADDRACCTRSAALCRRNRRPVRNDRRSRAASGLCDGRQNAFLQSHAKDGDPAGMTRRPGVRLFLFFFALYALTSSGSAFRVPDEFEVYFQAEHLIDAGDLSVPQTLTVNEDGTPIFFGRFGLDGKPYAPYGPGVAFVILPFHVQIGRASCRERV